MLMVAQGLRQLPALPDEKAAHPDCSFVNASMIFSHQITRAYFQRHLVPAQTILELKHVHQSWIKLNFRLSYNDKSYKNIFFNQL